MSDRASEAQDAGRNVDSKGHTDEISDGNEIPMGNLTGDYPCYMVAKNFTILGVLRLCEAALKTVD